nr:immunoglobulin light chain junction region [Macaca mulatta]
DYYCLIWHNNGCLF